MLDRAVTEIRKGRAIRLISGDKKYLVSSPETSAVFNAEFPVILLVSGIRLNSLMPERGYHHKAYAMQVNSETELNAFEGAYNPALKFASVEGDFTLRDDLSCLLKLMQIAELLPAAIIREVDEVPYDMPAITEDIILNAARIKADGLKLVVKGFVPLKAGDAEIHVFRDSFGGLEHMAVVFGDLSTHKAPLARVHSSCFTGDVLDSLKCDCGSQLHLAVQKIAADGCGVLVYVNQEGRGIGLANKLRAYNLQAEGLDTYEANLMLGFAEDERDFPLAAAILKALNVANIRLLTNNPGKAAGLAMHGINVQELVSVIAPTNENSKEYLRAKASKAGHILD